MLQIETEMTIELSYGDDGGGGDYVNKDIRPFPFEWVLHRNIRVWRNDNYDVKWNKFAIRKYSETCFVSEPVDATDNIDRPICAHAKLKLDSFSEWRRAVG